MGVGGNRIYLVFKLVMFGHHRGSRQAIIVEQLPELGCRTPEQAADLQLLKTEFTDQGKRPRQVFLGFVAQAVKFQSHSLCVILFCNRRQHSYTAGQEYPS